MGVIVYSISNCPKCSAAKFLLKRLNVKFEEHNVQEDRQRAREMVEKRRSVRPEESREAELPLVDVDGIIIAGFDREKMEQALKDKKLID